MFDKIDVSLLREYKLGQIGLVPVVWGYNENVVAPGYFPEGMFNRYHQASLTKMLHI